MTDLVRIPEQPSAAFSLVEQEQGIAVWLGVEDDEQVVREARRRLAALRDYYARSPEEAAAAARLDVLALARIGDLLGEPQPGRRSDLLHDVRGSTPAEQVMDHRARRVSAARREQPEVFAEALAAPRPSVAGVLRATSGAAWDAAVERIVSPETLRRSAIDGWVAQALALAEAFDRIDPPPSINEAGPALPSLESVVRRLRADRKMRVVQ